MKDWGSYDWMLIILVVGLMIALIIETWKGA